MRPLSATTQISAPHKLTVRQIVHPFAESGDTNATVADLLHARLHDLAEEHHRRRVIPAPSRA
ncbi:hypothetical protein CFP65_6874 [Kitasatospora sp. MMS16-BH015]|uniref:hypothetical protein n=1 Tax=Kitasatospora sp. MMS16-BH015 TaxID=2018025 RepID=UPI000CA10D75|nr:hypothetical protein [Kitasatospora sp. MMS16-BH015]AUG81501.1 hypothetical protein CFP65_6874 [Kitasatospora sp. MMS16-BH015]